MASAINEGQAAQNRAAQRRRAIAGAIIGLAQQMDRGMKPSTTTSAGMPGLGTSRGSTSSGAVGTNPNCAATMAEMNALNRQIQRTGRAHQGTAGGEIEDSQATGSQLLDQQRRSQQLMAQAQSQGCM
jgi:hypothetical protein